MSPNLTQTYDTQRVRREPADEEHRLVKSPTFLPPEDLEARECLVGETRFILFEWTPAAASALGAEALTQAEVEVLKLVVQGLSNADIARLRSSKTRTVANQVASILAKMGAGSRNALAFLWNHGDGAL